MHRVGGNGKELNLIPAHPSVLFLMLVGVGEAYDCNQGDIPMSCSGRKPSRPWYPGNTTHTHKY